MSRQERKNRTDIEFKGCGVISDALDDAVKQAWWINDDEYDHICEYATDEELDLFLGGDGSITDRKKALIMVDELLYKMYNLN